MRMYVIDIIRKDNRCDYGTVFYGNYRIFVNRRGCREKKKKKKEWQRTGTENYIFATA